MMEIKAAGALRKITAALIAKAGSGDVPAIKRLLTGLMAKLRSR